MVFWYNLYARLTSQVHCSHCLRILVLDYHKYVAIFPLLHRTKHDMGHSNSTYYNRRELDIWEERYWSTDCWRTIKLFSGNVVQKTFNWVCSYCLLLSCWQSYKKSLEKFIRACLPGQDVLWHGLYSIASPRWQQFLPPNIGSGLSQSRLHVSKPSPQVTLHALLNDQLP